MNEKVLKIAFNGLMFVIGICIIVLLLTGKSCNEARNHYNKIDTVVSLGKPIVNNYHFTNPTQYKETVIIYDSTKIQLTKQDSDYIVNDYLKRREYQDSINNGDTSVFYYHAIVEKNGLKDLSIRQWIRPKIYTITKIVDRPSLLLGGGVGWYGKPTFGLQISFQKDKFDYGLTYDPILKGGYLTVKRKFKL